MESQLAGSLTTLSQSLRSTKLDLEIGGFAQARADRDELADQITDYLLPRLKRLDAPLLVVLGGSTGSGKSTITNSLVGDDVSPAGVLRPTTRAPVLICHPSDEAWFAGGDVLPDLPRVTGEESTATGVVLRVKTVESMTPGLAIIDAPDIDSIEEANRDLATQLLSAADMWLFATTAVRYADAVPWDFLRQAQARGTALSIIINRIPTGASNEIVPHFESMLNEADLRGVQVYAIEQTELTDGRLAPSAISPLATMLDGLASDAERRAEIVRQTLDGAMQSIPNRVRNVAAAEAEQRAAVDELRASMEEIYSDTRENLSRDIGSGNLLRGEVLDRWQEMIGTAELMRAVQSQISILRDRITAFISGRSGATAEVQGEITATLQQLLIDHADQAAATTASTWRSLPGGRQILGDDRSLERTSEEFKNQVGQQVRSWQDDILELVRERGASKRTTARILAVGVNSIGIALMVLLFASTGGVTGGEIAIGAGTAGLSQTLLSAVFGEQAVRELAAEARNRLVERISHLLDMDANRFRSHLWAVVTPEAERDESVPRLPDALDSFEKAT